MCIHTMYAGGEEREMDQKQSSKEAASADFVVMVTAASNQYSCIHRAEYRGPAVDASLRISTWRFADWHLISRRQICFSPFPLIP
jgi:hypothetical protein